MANITAVVTRLRAALLREDEDTQRAVIAAYRTATRAIAIELDTLTARIANAVENGEEIGPSWLFRQERYRALLDQADRAMAQLTRDAGNVITTAQRTAVRQAQLDAAQLTLTAMGPPPNVGVGINFMRLPEEALTELVGTLQPGSPLRELIDRFGRDVSQAMQDALIEGLALGKSPERVAAQVRRAMGGEAWKARRLVRTELLRSYRSAALRSYRQNDRYVRAWRWMSTRSRRTCAACWAMHNRVFPLTTAFGSHVQCRCTPVPVTYSWRDLGFDVPDAPVDVETGPERFAKLPIEDRRFILGPTKHALYEDGDIELRDTVRTTRSQRWGTSRTVASTDEALVNAEQRKRRAA